MNPEQTRDYEAFQRSRRDFLGKIAKFSATGIAAGLGFRWSAEEALVMTETKPVTYPEPGWLETSLPERPPFLQIDRGHEAYLKYLGIKNPVLRDSLRRSFDGIFRGQYASRPRVGDCFEVQLENARLSLVEVMGDSEPATADIVHVAVATMAATYSPYLSCREVGNLGVAVPGSGGGKMSVFLHPQYEAVIPYLYPADPRTCFSEVDRRARCDGGDRMVHFSAHEFLSHQALYSLMNGLPDIWRIPNGARLLTSLLPENRLKVRVLDTLAQHVWEAEETRVYFTTGQSDYGRDGEGKVISSGYVDSHVGKDIKANSLGLSVGLALSRGVITAQDLNDVIVCLNNPILYQVT